MPVVVVPSDPAWPAAFEAEGDLLGGWLGPWLDGGIHHIGSTSVPGLAAKPTLDMIAGVRDLRRARRAIGVLTDLGYVHAEHRPRALWFYRPVGGEPGAHSHHLHLTRPGSDLWRERLGFRDALLADPALAAQYEALKLQLAAGHGDDPPAYSRGKREFVAGVLAGVGVRLRPPA